MTHLQTLVAAILLCFICPCPAQSESRTWTAPDGRTLEGSLFEVHESGVVVRRSSDGRKLPLKWDMISAEDRKFVEKFEAVKKANANLDAAELQRTEGLKSGPYADLITGEFVRSRTTSGLPFQLCGAGRIKATERYPLVLFLHGGGTRGGDEDWPVGSGAMKLIDEEWSDDHPCFVVAPRCAIEENWMGKYGDEAAVLVRDLVANLPIDVDRIYVTGGSLGGGGCWYQIVEHQEIYAGALILCNAGSASNASKLKDFPIRQFHGDEDPDHPVARAQEMAAAMEKAGASRYLYTELKGEGHVIHPTVYGNAENFEWLFEQRKSDR